MVYLREHGTGYAPRTVFNAANSCLTLAFTVDDQTAGERLTRKVATDAKYGHINLHVTNPPRAARDIANLVKLKLGGKPVQIINVAGNGIYTLSRHGWTQEKINQYLVDTFRLLREEHRMEPAKGFRSGGQTGVDIAAAVMAEVMRRDAVITFPNGYLQRGADGKDFRDTKESVSGNIKEMAAHVVWK